MCLVLGIAFALTLKALYAQDYGLYFGDRDMERGISYAYPGIQNLSSQPFTWPTIAQQFSDPTYDWGSLDFCYGIALARDGVWWACNILGNRLEKFSATTGQHLGSVSTYFTPTGVAVVPANTSVGYFVDVTTQGSTIERYDPSSNTWSTFATVPYGSTYGLRWRRERLGWFLYVTARGAGLYKIDAGGSIVWGPVAHPSGAGTYYEVDFAPNGDVLVACTNGLYSGTGYIWRVDANGNSLGDFAVISGGSSPPYSSGTPMGLAVAPPDSSGNVYVYTTEYGNGTLLAYLYDPNTGNAGNNGNPVSAVKVTTYSRPKVGLGLEIGPKWTPGRTCPADVNGDGIVDDADLLIVLFNFGTQCR